MVVLYYAICFFASLLLAGIYVSKWHNRYNIYITLLYILVPISNYGFWQIAISKNVEQALLANKITYIGSTLSPLAIMFCIFFMCRVNIPKAIRVLLDLITVSILMASFTAGYHAIFYKSASIEFHDGYTTLVKDYNIVHSLFYIMMGVYLLMGLIALIYGISKRKDVSIYSCVLLLGCNLQTLLCFTIGRMIGEVELTPLGYDISLILFLVISDRLVLYNVDETVTSTLLERGDIGVVSFDLKNHFLGCNDVAESFFAPLSELHVDRKIPQDEKYSMLREWIKQINEENETAFTYEDQENYYKISVESLYDGKKIRGYHLLFQDCTEDKKHEKMLEKQAEDALLASEAKGRFLANMSHEIRTPITAVLGLDTMILRESKEPQIIDYAIDIESAGHTLLALINDILDFSKIESGKMEIINAEYDLANLIHDVINMSIVKAKMKQLEIKLELDEGLPTSYIGDDMRIRQVLVNLMNNAVKYTESGSITLNISGERDGNYANLHFAVRDTGIGIKQEDIEKLFHAFERIEEKRNRSIEGTGLGLNITVQLLELMGSKLQVKSTYGEGSTFYFDLRQEITNQQEIGNLQVHVANRATTYAYKKSFTAPDAKVLVVDDNAMNRRVFVSLLKETLIQIDEASGGREALDMITSKEYDMIFLDHMMPEMDGLEVMKQMLIWESDREEKIPVIALTANAISGAKDMYMEAGFNDYLTKPMDASRLEKMLIRYLPDEKIFNETYEEEPDNSQMEDSDELPEVDGIDWKYALLKLEDVALVKEVVHDFVFLADDEIATLKTLYQNLLATENVVDKEEAFQAYCVKVHAMKSTSATIGAIGVSALARLLEFAARQLNQEKIVALMDTFCEEWDKLVQGIRSAFAETTTSDEPTRLIAREELFAKLNVLDEAMEILDADTADAIIEELQKYSYSEHEKEFMHSLAIAVRNLDIEKTHQIIQEWMK